MSQAVITVGGVGVLAAVLGLCVYLAWVVAPLFAGAKVSVVAENTQKGPAAAESRDARDISQKPLVSVFDEDGRAMLELQHSGAIRVISARSGFELASLSLPGTIQPTATSEPQRGGLFAVGFADGTIRLGSIGFFDALLADRDIPANARTLKIGDEVPFPEKNGADRSGLGRSVPPHRAEH